MLNEQEINSLSKCLRSKCQLPELEYTLSGNKPCGYCALSITNKEAFKEKVNKFRQNHKNFTVNVIHSNALTPKPALITIGTMIGGIAGIIFILQLLYGYFISVSNV